jgi:hypothetical protein
MTSEYFWELNCEYIYIMVRNPKLTSKLKGSDIRVTFEY